MSESSQGPKERLVRVFVSSTFRDMNAEREELSKFIFPELRRFCRERDVEFIEVDLRWGVTEEQSQLGETLAVCLAEIDHCRPYFIGLLGERYGWVPDKFSEDVIRENSWMNDLHDRSVTELEILYGVLNNPNMANRAYFYFRDPHYLNKIQTEKQVNFASENEGAAKKLTALKQRIRESGLPLVESYPDPHNVAVQIGERLRRAIEEEFPITEVRDHLAEESTGHEKYAQSRAKIYVSRESNLAYINNFVTGLVVNKGIINQSVASKTPQSTSLPEIQNRDLEQGQIINVLAVLGPSGCGKSALLANWALNWRKTHPNEFVFLHFFGSTPGSANYLNLLSRLIEELKVRFEISQDLPDTPEALRIALPNWLAMAAAKCSRLVLVLDGLNQIEDRDQAPDLVWLPAQFPTNVKVLVSTLPGRSLNALRKRPHSEFEVQLLDQKERLCLVDAYLGRFKKHLEERRAKRIISSESSANPLYLRILLEELRQFGSYEQLDERIEHYLQARSIDVLYDKVLERMEYDYEGQRPKLVKEALGLIWVAHRGLSESELLELMGDVPRAIWSPLYLALEESLVERNGVINFFHDFLRKAVHDRYLPSIEEQVAIRNRLADYFEQHLLNNRQIDELPWLLSQLEDWQRLYGRLADPQFFSLAWSADEYEVKSYWSQVETHSNLRKLEAYRPILESPQKYLEIIWQVATLFENTGHLKEALKLRFYLVEHYRQTGDDNNLAASLGNQANILKSSGNLDQSIILHKEEERIFRKLSNLEGLGTSLGSQAVILYTQGDLVGSMALMKEQEQICRQMGDIVGLAHSLGSQAVILQDRGDLDGAMLLNKEQERICLQLGKLDGLIIALGNQALILKDKGDLTQALALQREKERICRQLGDMDNLQSSLGNQAVILKIKGDLNGAMTLHQEQERICRQSGYLDALQSSLGNQAGIFYTYGDLDRAMALFKEQEQISRNLNNLESLSICFNNQALILKAHGDVNGALALLKESEQISRTLGNLNKLQGYLGNQAVIHGNQGNLDEAMTLYKDQENICRQSGYPDGLQHSLGGQALILMSRGDIEGALTLLNEQESICRKSDYQDGLQSCLGKLASIYYTRGNIAKTFDLYGEKERICRQTGNLLGLVSSLNDQALIFYQNDELSMAMDLFKEVEQIARKSNNKDVLQRSLGNQANIKKDRGDLEEAIDLLKEQENVCIELGNTKELKICQDKLSTLENEWYEHYNSLARMHQNYISGLGKNKNKDE